jgi:glucose/arabinose dehydrogenase
VGAEFTARPWRILVPSRRLIPLIATVMVLTAIFPAGSVAAPSLSARTIQSGLVIPWDVAFVPTGQMIVTERPGRVRIYASARPGAALLATTTIGGVRAQGEAGLMGVAVDHLFRKNRLIYVCASRMDGGQWLNQVLRYRVRGDWKLSFDRFIIRNGMLANTIHNGCAVEEGPDRMIWVTMGDAANSALAQNPNRLNGKVLRVGRDGSVPADNPILPGANQRRVTYSMGHRNPQGIAFQPGSGRVYVVEHGPERDDEINWIRKGKNYGWPCVTGRNHPYAPGTSGCPSGTSAFTRPVWSSEGPTLATSNGVFLPTHPRWNTWGGHLIVSTLKQEDLRRFTFDSGPTPATQRQTLYNGSWGRLRSTVIGPGYQLFVTTSNGSNDRIIRITP